MTGASTGQVVAMAVFGVAVLVLLTWVAATEIIEWGERRARRRESSGLTGFSMTEPPD